MAVDMEALIIQAEAAYRGFETEGTSVLRAAREGMDLIGGALSLVDLFPRFAEQLQSEGASEYQALLATEAARIAWYAHMMRRAAAANQDHELLKAIALATLTSLTEGRLFTNVVHRLARQFDQPEAEVSMFLNRLVKALLPKADPA